LSSTSDTTAAVNPIRLGVIGLGRAFMLTLPALRADPRVNLVAACDPRAEARKQFEQDFGGRAYADAAEICRDPQTEAIYIASPHQLHAEHAIAAAQAGKHILLEKPMAIAMQDASRLVEATERAGVHLIVGPSHSFDTPVAQARRLIDSGDLGPVRMIQAFNYTDFLYRPRRPEELRTSEGGGVIFSQGVHQIDIVRLLAGGLGRDVTALTGAWDPDRPTEGAYSALMTFENGCFASLTYSGYAHFDSDLWMDNIGELGHTKKPGGYGRARAELSRVKGPDQEVSLKTARTYGLGSELGPAQSYEHFGPIIVLCDRGDIRLTPFGLHIYGDVAQEFRPAPALRVPRAEVIDALVGALRRGTPPVQSGRWALASLEVCHAIVTSAAARSAVRLTRQVAV
jgi:phthalate 4,5-cis-dihydrodiol dehydrogenase